MLANVPIVNSMVTESALTTTDHDQYTLPPFHQIQNENVIVTPTSMECTNDDLPPFAPVPTPTFCWGDRNGQEFTHAIDLTYKEVVHWKWKLFKLPSGKAGKSFVCEPTRLFQAYADGSALECMALQAAMVMPALILQKPHPKSKAKDHAKHLARWLQLWT